MCIPFYCSVFVASYGNAKEGFYYKYIRGNNTLQLQQDSYRLHRNYGIRQRIYENAYSSTDFNYSLLLIPLGILALSGIGYGDYKEYKHCQNKKRVYE